MAELVVMPKLGFDMKEGTFAAWVKQVGDTIKSGDVIAEVETDKATVEVETYTSGTLLHVIAEAGDILEVGAPIAVIGQEGEDYSSLLGGDAAPTKEAAESAPVAASEQKQVAPTPAEDKQTAAASTPKPAPASAPARPAASGNGHKVADDGRVKASPVARRIASERGINLHYVQGSGPEGRIIRTDVENYTPSAAPAAGVSIGIGAAPSYTVLDLPHEVIDVSRLRGTIAKRMAESTQHVPHFMVTMDMDTTALLELRTQLNARLDDDHKLTINDLIVKATALTLREFPNLNTHYHGDKFIRYHDINIGIAVALPQGGLINVVARNADTTTLSTMAKQNKIMIAKAREGKVRPEDIEGSTFTVSNLGAYGVEHFTAIINPPEAGILAVGASQKTPVVNEAGELTIGNRMKVTISVDHRTSDGAEGAEFMRYFKGLIEEPMRLLI